MRCCRSAYPEVFGAVVLPGTFFPLAYFGVVPLKRVAMIQVARKMVAPNLKPGSKNGGKLSSRGCKARVKATWKHPGGK